MADIPREVFRQMLTMLSTTSFHELPLSERGAWLPSDVREAISHGWVVTDGPDAGMFGQPVGRSRPRHGRRPGRRTAQPKRQHVIGEISAGNAASGRSMTRLQATVRTATPRHPMRARRPLPDRFDDARVKRNHKIR
jgi:hypothetical protein